MDLKRMASEESIVRREALSLLWEQYYRDNGGLLDRLPSSSCTILLADHILANPEAVAAMTEIAKRARYTPIPARVWFDENKGICPTCGLDMNNLLGKDDFSVVPHINGTCKG